MGVWINLGGRQSAAWSWDLWMRQGQHRLHATNGTAIIPDVKGTFVRGANDLARVAQKRIRGLQAAMPPGLDWSGWMLDVHDARGRHVAFVDFTQEGTILDGYAHELSGPAVRVEAEAALPGPSGHGAE